MLGVEQGTNVRYIIRATGETGPIEFRRPLTIEAAMRKAAELKAADFQHITLINTQTGVEITDLEELVPGVEGDA